MDNWINEAIFQNGGEGGEVGLQKSLKLSADEPASWWRSTLPSPTAPIPVWNLGHQTQAKIRTPFSTEVECSF